MSSSHFFPDLSHSGQIRLRKAFPWLLLGITFLIWLWTLSPRFFLRMGNYQINQLGRFFGLAGYAYLSFALLFNSRLPLLEKLFGGLDCLYRLHHTLGSLGFFFMLIHPITFSLKWLFTRPEKALFFITPIHHIDKNLGVFSFWLFVLLLMVTYCKVLSYSKWKCSHSFLFMAFFIAALHIHLIGLHHKTPFLLSSFQLILTSLGILSFALKWVRPQKRYSVTHVEKLSPVVTSITLMPLDKPCSFIPGQFGFFSFWGKEAHPFTFCSHSKDQLTITVKNLGDFTSRLLHELKKDDIAFLEGPYGSFDYRKGLPRQVWIAGGIGITPFLSWVRSIEKSALQVDLYYTVPYEEEALFLEEFAAYSSFLTLHLIPSRKRGHITASEIKKELGTLSHTSLFMCGPPTMTQDLKKQFLALGLSEDDIFTEDFAFYST